ncbi:MAG: ATP-binding protein [Breznakibacter sp.]
MITQPTNIKPSKILNPRHWFWAAIVLSVIICVLIVYLHYRQKEVLIRSAQTIDDFRQARIDLAKGFLYCGLSEDKLSPFDQNEGIAYIDQAVIAIKHNLSQLNSFPLYSRDNDLQFINLFIDKSASFQTTLKKWDTQARSDKKTHLQLKITYHELEKMADHVDDVIVQSFNHISLKFNHFFIITLTLAAGTLTSICIILFVAVGQNKKSEKALKESELNLRKLFDNMLNGLAYCKLIKENGTTEDFLFLGVNNSFCRLTKLHDVVGQKMTTVIPSIWKTDQTLLKLFERVATTGETESTEVYVTAFNEWFALKVYSTRHDHFLMVFDIITERVESEILLKQKNDEIEAQNEEYRQINEELKEAKKRAEESDRLKTAFLANMSHEIRTPMNAIVGFAEFIVDPDIPVEKKEWYASIIKGRSYDLLRIIEDILDVSRIEVGLLSIVKEPVMIGNTLRDTFEFYKEKLATSNLQSSIRLNIQVDPKIANLKIMTDEQRLKQILNNLLDNALKFTHQGTIELGCNIRNDLSIIYYVSDTGIGIAAEKQEIIFDRFRQAEDAMTIKKYGGTGLGLSIVKGLAGLMDGKVWVTSELGKGSTFTVGLPLQIVEEPVSCIGQQDDHQFFPTNSPVKVLIVEDDTTNMEYLKEALSRPEIELFAATDGEKALKSLARDPNIKIVLMDIRLPDMNGLELARFIKQEYPQIKIIAQTAYASNFDKYECIQAGCDDYLPKPISLTNLISLVAKHAG